MAYRHRAAAIISLLLIFSGGLAFGQPPQEKTSKTEFYFNAPCTISIYGKAPEHHFEEIFLRMAELEKQLDLYDDSSALSELNRNAGTGPVAVPDAVYEVVRHGVAYSHLTGGAFDISVGPLVRVWAVNDAEPGVPSPDDIEEGLSNVDYRRVILLEPEQRILLEIKGMALDLGGIARGYAADVAVSMLRDQGHNHALVDFGGNIVAVGSRPDGAAWRVGIPHPERSAGDPIGVVEVRDKTVVTSRKHENYFWQGGVRYHHIIDTATGYPVENGVAGVTIISDSSMKADALSTAVFALGLEKGLALIGDFDGVEALVVTDENQIYGTEAVLAAFKLVDSRFTIAP